MTDTSAVVPKTLTASSEGAGMILVTAWEDRWLATL